MTLKSLIRNPEDAEAWLAAIVSSSSDAIVGKTLDGTVISWNGAAERLFGYREDEMIGQSIGSLIPPGRQSEEDRILVRIAAGDHIEHYETERLRKDGRLIEVCVTVSPVRNAAGTIVGASKVARDITERKEAEKLIRASEERRYRQIFEINPHPMWIYDIETLRFLEVNSAAIHRYGYSRDEFLGMTIADIRPPEDVARLKETIFEAGTKPVPSDWRHKKKDGTVIDVEISWRALNHTGRSAAMAMAQDVTARKKAERALKDSEERLRLALDAAELGLWRSDAGSGSKIWDARCRELFGTGPGTPVTYDTWASAILPEDRAEAEATVMRALDPASPHDEFVLEYRVKHPDGKVLWLASSGRAFFAPDSGSPAGRRSLFICGTIRDATKDHRAEAVRSEREDRDRYFVKLDERIRDARGAREAVNVACEILGHELGAAFVGVGELHSDSNHTLVSSVWSSGDASLLLGSHDSVAPERIAELLAGGMLTIDDVVSDPRTANDRSLQAAYRKFDVRASIGVPLERGGRLRAFLFAAQSAPRAWTQFDMTLAQGTLDRTWQAVERARTEEELRLTKDRFELALKSSPVILFCQDRDLRYTWIYNPALGYKPSEVIGKKDSDLFEREEDVAVLEAIKRDVIRTGVGQRREVAVRSKGVDRYYDLLADPLLSDDGTIQGVRCAAIDITEREQAQQALSKAEEFERQRREEIEALLAAIPVAVVIAEDAGCVKMTGNRAAYELLRLPPHMSLSKSAPPELAPDNFELYANGRLLSVEELPVQRAAATKTPVFGEELEIRFVDGERKYALCNALPLFGKDGAVRGAVGAFMDVTDRKRAEAALRRSEEIYRGVFKDAGTGIAITGLDGRFQSCNPAYSSMLGFSEEELREMHFSDRVHPEDRETNQVEIRRLLAQEIPSFEIVNRYMGKSGKGIWVHKHVSLLRDDAGEPFNIIALVTDMTERKRQEEQNALLMREVNHRSKNILTLVHAIARQTAATSARDFAERFGDRIAALSRSYDLLVKSDWKGVSLNELIESQLEPFKDLIGERVQIKGPPVSLSPSAAQTLCMALHELSTNASKYGALSNSRGKVTIEWWLGQKQCDQIFAMSWREVGARIVAPPSKRGFGTTVISSIVEHSLDAKVDLDFAPEGLIWRVECRAGEVLDSNI